MSNKSDFRELGSLVDLGGDFGRELGNLQVIPTYEEIEADARSKAWTQKANVFSDLSMPGSEELKVYNRLLGNPDKYMIIAEDAKWVEEKFDKETRIKYSVFVKYIEFDENKFKEILEELLVKFDKKENEKNFKHEKSFGMVDEVDELSLPGKEKKFNDRLEEELDKLDEEEAEEDDIDI